MGQQQLILLVLATIIVGLAIVVGIRTFTENSTKSNSDALMQDAVRMANDAQAWKQKPAMFGGQTLYTGATVANDVDNFTGTQLERIGYAVTSTGIGLSGSYENLNGEFGIVQADEAGLLIVGYSDKFRNLIVVSVTGLADSTISGYSICLGGQHTYGGVCGGTIVDILASGTI